MRTALDATPSPPDPGYDPAEEGFTQIEFPPTYTDFATARRRFLDQISLSAHDGAVDAPTPRQTEA